MGECCVKVRDFFPPDDSDNERRSRRDIGHRQNILKVFIILYIFLEKVVTQNHVPRLIWLICLIDLNQEKIRRNILNRSFF